MAGVVIVVVVFPLFCDLFGDFDVACIFAFVTIVIEQEVGENCTNFVRYPDKLANWKPKIKILLEC